MKKNELLETSKNLVNLVLDMCNGLSKTQGISNIIFQLRKSVTSVHANIREGNYPQSLPDMLSKFQIAKKECFETEGWLQTLKDGLYIEEDLFKKIRNIAGKVRRLLIASCKTIEAKISK